MTDKAPEMPEIEPDDGEIERHDAHYRLNPTGDKELVIKKKGEKDEETLSELAEDLCEMIEYYGEGVDFAGPSPAMSPEQQGYERTHNAVTPMGSADSAPQLVRGDHEEERIAQDSPNDFTSTTKQASDGPELSRIKSRIKASAVRGKPSRNKYITGYGGDRLDYGATHSESFTGTGAIAIGPAPYDTLDDEDDEDDQDKAIDTSESLMPVNKRILREWEPSFAGGGDYDPGDYQMPSPIGNGVAERKPKKDKVGSYDTNTSNQGKEWPRKHNDTPAMCDVDDDGVENKPQGSHESSVGEPTDGHQTEMGHNWPDEAKNSGSGVAEPFEGNRWSDGGTLKGGSGQDELSIKSGGSGMPSKGTITGTSGPQYGQPSEGRWTPSLFATMMEGETNVHVLFNSYARDIEAVCLEDFQSLCKAHGCEINLDETSLVQLMKANREFIFYEGTDANGPYWVPTPLAEGKGPFPGAAPLFGSDDSDSDSDSSDSDCDDSDADSSDSDCDDSDSDDSDTDSGKPWESRSRGKGRRRTLKENRRRHRRRMINELQVGRPDRPDRPGMGPDMGPGPGIGPGIGPDMGPGMGQDLEDSDYYEDNLADFRADEAMTGPGSYGSDDSCPECGAEAPGEAVCPECGAEMDGMGGMGMDAGGIGDEGMLPDPMGSFEDDVDENLDFGAEMGGEDEFEDEDEFGDGFGDEFGIGGMDEMGRMGGMGGEEDDEFAEMETEFSPNMEESLKRFMVSARNIIGRNQGNRRTTIGEALNHSWDYHANGINPRRCPTKVKGSLQELMNKFPGFNPLTEGGSDAMDGASGNKISDGSASNTSEFLPKSDSDTTDEGEAWPRKHKTQSSPEETPIIKGTEKGMTGTGGQAKSVKENVNRLAKYIRKPIREGAKGLRGKFTVQFTCLVNEGNGLKRTIGRKRLAEALADAEELLQMHPADQVVLETYYGKGKRCLRKYNIPLTQVKVRRPIVSGGKALFRFNRTAEAFAEGLVSKGTACRVGKHRWGSAVTIVS